MKYEDRNMTDEHNVDNAYFGLLKGKKRGAMSTWYHKLNSICVLKRRELSTLQYTCEDSSMSLMHIGKS